MSSYRRRSVTVMARHWLAYGALAHQRASVCVTASPALVLENGSYLRVDLLEGCGMLGECKIDK